MEPAPQLRAHLRVLATGGPEDVLHAAAALVDYTAEKGAAVAAGAEGAVEQLLAHLFRAHEVGGALAARRVLNALRYVATGLAAACARC